jgi:hypothetical protein
VAYATLPMTGARNLPRMRRWEGSMELVIAVFVFLIWLSWTAPVVLAACQRKPKRRPLELPTRSVQAHSLQDYFAVRRAA